MPLGEIIRTARTFRNLKQKDVADAFGITRPAVGNWEAEGGPHRDKMPKLAELLGIDLDAALNGELVYTDWPSSKSERPVSNARIPEKAPAPNLVRLKGPRNVPVYGTGSGGKGGDFRFNGQRIDNAPRPPGIQDRQGVYVIYVVGDSVSPRYEDGDPIYVDPHRRPAPRDYVVIELWGEDDEPGEAYVKRLVSRSGGKIIVEQHTPPAELTFKEADVKELHRVIPWTELIGI